MNGKKQRVAFRRMLSNAALIAKDIETLTVLRVLTAKDAKNLKTCVRNDLVEAYAKLPDRK